MCQPGQDARRVCTFCDRTVHLVSLDTTGVESLEDRLTLASRDEAVENIRQRTDIVELISRYVKLKKTGSNFVGLCPFHAEKTPSFTVSPRKGFFHCFGCRSSGDAFSFLMKIEGKTFPEVLEDLAARAGIELPRRKPVNQQARELKHRLLEINELAATYYEQNLWDSEAGRRAVDYLAQRQLEPQLCRRFRLGYAPGGWQNLTDHLKRANASLQEAQSLGLLAVGDRGHYDIFRDRLVFPIFGMGGKVSGFGARKLDSEAQGPKYINSRQSRVFDKSEILYGLYQARTSIQNSDQVILVEGYFDVLSLVQAGVENVVATCGTALSESHVRIVKRFADKVITIFDADQAGIAASYRSTALLLGEDLSPYMVSMPAGEDPDSLVRARGGDGFKKLLEGARPTIEVLADLGLKNGNDVEARTAALKKLIPMLVASKDRLRLGNYVRLIADRFDLDEDYIRQAVRQAEQRQRAPAKLSGQPASSGDSPERIPLHIEEETCLVLLLKFPHLAQRIADSGVLERFESEAARGLVRKFLAAGTHISPAPLLDSIENQQLRDRLSSKLINDSETPEDKADSSLEDCIRKVRLRHIKRELRSLSGQISRAEKDGRDEERRQLTLNKMRLDQERRSLEGL